MKFGLLSVLALGLAVSACETVGPANAPEKADMQDYMALYARAFATAPDNTENRIRDRRVRVNSPNLPGVWYYTQLNSGEDYKVYRQRLSTFALSEDGTAIVQTSYQLKNPKRFEYAWNKPELLAATGKADYEQLFTPGCEQIWRPQQDGSWHGYVDPKSCTIHSKRRNTQLRIESEGRLYKDVYQTNERGYDLDMKQIWGTKPGEFINLYPVKSGN